MIYLHKILPFFVSPLGIIFIFLFMSFFFKKKFFVFLAFVFLIISTNPLVGNYLMKRLEYPYKPIPISSIKENDAVIVLGGMLNKVGDQNYNKYEFSDPDRFLGGIDLIKSFKSKKLILMSSQLPWTVNWQPEGQVLKEKAISLGLDPDQIFVTEKVKNTYEESIAVTKLIPNNSSIILVTSAYHMDRSKYLFENQGFKVNAFPVDFKSSNQELSLISFLPNVDSLYKTSLFIRENLGRFYYNFIL